MSCYKWKVRDVINGKLVWWVEKYIKYNKSVKNKSDDLIVSQQTKSL